MIASLVKKHAVDVACPPLLNAEALLWAIYYCEKYNAHNREPRFEAAYAPGGWFYEHSPAVRTQYDKWGRYAACSYSNFQMLFIVATELGYGGPPLALDKDSVCLPYVVDYLNRRVFAYGATKPEQVADAYNSGSFKDAYVPTEYVAKFMRFYEREDARIQRENQSAI
jgi:hypothetical protein